MNRIKWTSLRRYAHWVAAQYAGDQPHWVKVKEHRGLHRPAYKVLVKLPGQRRGRCVAEVLP